MAFYLENGTGPVSNLQIMVSSDFVFSVKDEFALYDSMELFTPERMTEVIGLIKRAWDYTPISKKWGVHFDDVIRSSQDIRRRYGSSPSIPAAPGLHVLCSEFMIYLHEVENYVQHTPASQRDSSLFTLETPLPPQIPFGFINQETTDNKIVFKSPEYFSVNFLEYFTGGTGEIIGTPVRDVEEGLVKVLLNPNPLNESDKRGFRDALEVLFCDKFFVSKFVEYLSNGAPTTSNSIREHLDQPVDVVSNQASLPECQGDSGPLKTYRALQRLVHDGDTVLDAGTGTGISPWLWQHAVRDKKGVRVYGMDQYFDNLDSWYVWGKQRLQRGSSVKPLFSSLQSAELPEPQFLVGSLFNSQTRDGLPFPKYTFDVVILGHVLRYIAKEHGAFVTAEVGRVTKPGGHVVVYEGDYPQVFVNEV